MAVVYLVGLKSKEIQVRLKLLTHQHWPGYRGSGTPELTDPQAFQSREAVPGMRTAYRVVYGLYAVSHTAAPCTRTRDGLAYRRLLFIDGMFFIDDMFFVFNYFRGVNH